MEILENPNNIHLLPLTNKKDFIHHSGNDVYENRDEVNKEFFVYFNTYPDNNLNGTKHYSLRMKNISGNRLEGIEIIWKENPFKLNLRYEKVN